MWWRDVGNSESEPRKLKSRFFEKKFSGTAMIGHFSQKDNVLCDKILKKHDLASPKYTHKHEYCSVWPVHSVSEYP